MGSLATADMHPYQSLPIDERVKRVLRDTPLFDGHNDLPQQPRCCNRGRIYDKQRFDLEKGFAKGMTDIPRLREGKASPNFDNMTELISMASKALSEHSSGQSASLVSNRPKTSPRQSTAIWLETQSSN
jgi:hypothetical protein